MALIKCSECSNDVSDKAPACPKCGAPMHAPNRIITPVVAAPVKGKSAFTLGRVVIWGIVLIVLVAFFSLRSGKGLTGAVTGPKVLTDERVDVSDGDIRTYSYSLPSPRKLELHITSTAKGIDVITMEDASYQKWVKAKTKLFGGGTEYRYVPTLSEQKVMKSDGAGVLPAGTWDLVIFMPKESLFSKSQTQVAVKVLGY
jgi:hypothetical protein